jgi:hypothetical protein
LLTRFEAAELFCGEDDDGLSSASGTGEAIDDDDMVGVAVERSQNGVQGTYTPYRALNEPVPLPCMELVTPTYMQVIRCMTREYL